MCLTYSFITCHITISLNETSERNLTGAFSSLWESSNKDKITPHALVKLLEDVGGPVSLEQAQAMMQNWYGEWSKADLERILSSPSTTGTNAPDKDSI